MEEESEYDKRCKLDHERLIKAARKIKKELGFDSIVITGTRTFVESGDIDETTTYFQTTHGNAYACRASVQRYLNREEIRESEEFSDPNEE